MTIVRVDRQVGLKPEGCRNRWFRLVKREGRLIYTSEHLDGILGAFISRHGAEFGISTTDGVKKFFIHIGTYRGGTHEYDAMNYLQYRKSLFKDYGTTGHEKVDKAIGIAMKIGNWQETIATAVLNPKKKAFIAFTGSGDQLSDNYQVMDNQESVYSIPADAPARKMTLNDIYENYLRRRI